MISKFEFYKDVCNNDLLVCLSSLESDLSYYYNWNIQEHKSLDNIYNSFCTVYDHMWDVIKNTSDEYYNKDLILDGVKLVKGDPGVYYNVVKIDLNKAFTNYIFSVANEKFLNIFKNICYEIAKTKIPKSSKKFLYNYTLTNLLTKKFNINTLYELRFKVYEDVLYSASKMGNIIKTEIDGAYIQTYMKEIPKLDISGKLTITKYNWLILYEKLLIGKTKNNVIKLKGFSYDTPNIQKHYLKKLLLCNTNKQRDLLIEEYLFSNNIHILDWAYKTVNGEKILLKYDNVNIEMNSITDKDISMLNDSIKNINRDNYIKEILPVYSMLFETIG